MPTYKNLPRSKGKKDADLPFYRPIDHLVMTFWEKRKALTPFLAVGAVVLILFAGMKAYFSYYDGRAEAILASGDPKSLETLIKDYSRAPASFVARMKLAKTAMDQKDWGRAIDLYGPVSSSASVPSLLRIAALQNAGLALLKKGDAPQALAILEKASKDPGNADPEYSELLLARAHEMSGDKEKAKEKYKSLSEGAKNAAVKEEAKERLSWLD